MIVSVVFGGDVVEGLGVVEPAETGVDACSEPVYLFLERTIETPIGFGIIGDDGCVELVDAADLDLVSGGADFFVEIGAGIPVDASVEVHLVVAQVCRMETLVFEQGISFENGVVALQCKTIGELIGFGEIVLELVIEME